jgi:DNA polymerase elongation subunit (family B)
MQNIYMDIETIPNQSPEYRAKVRETIKPPGTIKKPESILAWLDENAESATDEAIAKTSFDPAYGHICCIGWAIEDGPALALSARTLDEEKTILIAFFEALPKMGMACFIGHYISGFDLRFILCRAIVLGVPIPKIIPRDIKPWSHDIFDTMVSWAGNKGTISQDRLCDALGLSGKGDFDGSMVAQAWSNGEHERIADYCRSDVETVRAIHRRFVAVGY